MRGSEKRFKKIWKFFVRSTQNCARAFCLLRFFSVLFCFVSCVFFVVAADVECFEYLAVYLAVCLEWERQRDRWHWQCRSLRSLRVSCFVVRVCGRLNALFGTLENADECACVCVCLRFLCYPLSVIRLALIQSVGAADADAGAGVDAGSACIRNVHSPVSARDRYPCSRSQWPRACAPLQHEQVERQAVIQRCTHSLTRARSLSHALCVASLRSCVWRATFLQGCWPDQFRPLRISEL